MNFAHRVAWTTYLILANKKHKNSSKWILKNNIMTKNVLIFCNIQQKLFETD